MAALSKRSRTFFRLSPAAGEVVRFAVRRGDVKEGRFDTAFRLSERSEKGQSKYKTTPLNKLVNFYSGGTPSKARGDFWDGDIPWVSPKDFGRHTIYDSEDHISSAGLLDASLHIIPENSLLMVVRSGVLKHSLPVAVTGRNVTINQDLKAMIPLGEVLARYLADYFVVFGKQVLPAISKHSTTVQSLNTPQLESLPIPLPPLETQQVLVNELEAARSSRRDKLAQADALLSGLDGWLLDQLGLQPPQEDKRACFAVRLGDVRSRFDADFHSPRFQSLRASIEDSGFEIVSVKEVAVYIKSGFASGRDDQADDAESGVPHIRPMNITPQGEFSLANAKFVPHSAVSAGDWLQKGEVIFNNTNSTAWVGKTGVFAGETECACSNHMTRIQFNQKVVPDFVAPLFNALRSTGLFGLMSTNFNNQAGINSTTLEMFRFPLPQLPTQQTIADEVRSRRETARRLRDEANAEWSAAKARFERQLLGETKDRVLDVAQNVDQGGDA